MKLRFLPIRTRVIHPPKDDIYDVIDGLKVKDGDIVFITSKIMGIHQGRTCKISAKSKEELIRSEAERYLSYKNGNSNFSTNITVVQNTLMLSAGIDKSNADGYYIMWPKNIDKLCKEIRSRLMQKHHLKNLGVVATDSHSTPLRLGVTGITIGLAGIEPLKDIRGEKDLFGEDLKITRVNMVDPLSAMAVKIMGESNECTPIVILRDYKDIAFSDTASMKDLKVEPESDIYRPLIDVLPKI